MTDEEITSFLDFVKLKGGSDAKKVSTKYLGKQTHSAVAIGLAYFDRVTQKRLLKTVRNLLQHNWSINSRCVCLNPIQGF